MKLPAILLLLLGPLFTLTAHSHDDMADKVLVDKSERRLYLMQGESVLREYPIALGLAPRGHKEREGDFRTPEGDYLLTRRLTRSEFFLAIQISYPNDIDEASAQRLGVDPGGRIMIHGQPNRPKKPDSYYETFDWTDGCIAVSNSDMVDLWRLVADATPIDIRP